MSIPKTTIQFAGEKSIRVYKRVHGENGKRWDLRCDDEATGKVEYLEEGMGAKFYL